MTKTIDFPELKATDGKIAERRQELREIFADAGDTIDLTKVKAFNGDKNAALDRIRALNTELDNLTTEREGQAEVLKAARRSAGNEAGDGHVPAAAEGRTESKAIGDAFVKSAAYKGRVRGGDSPEANLTVELKTLMETGAGFAPESVRSGLIVDYATRPVQVTDLVPSMPWDQAAYKYMDETTFTNNAAEAAEGAAWGEAALAYTERTVTIENITVWLPVTDLQLESVPYLTTRLNTRLPFMLRQRLDGQLLNGDGVTPNILGVNNKVGIQTQAKGADPVLDAILKAAVKVQHTGFALANAVVLEPTDLQDIRLTRTADGIYILGSPTDATIQRIWGMTPVAAGAQTTGTAVVGDFANYSELLINRDVTVKVSNSHSDYFVKGKQAIRADIRVASAWTRAAAFCTVTGI